MARIEAVHHVALTVADCDASARWYGEVLGFVERFREESEERRARVMGFAEGGYSVGLVEHRGMDGARFAPSRTGLDHLAFTVGSREELDGWASRLSSAGVEHSGVTEIGVGAILNFEDPDGISLALFWDE